MTTKSLNIALVGNPNAGKSSLFNALTGLRQKVGNFPGVTVDKKEGVWEVDNIRHNLIDLPGIYSLTPKSLDEVVSCEVLLQPNHPLKPDVIILVLNAANLKRNLFLASQVIDLGIPVIVALNMRDIAEKSGISINHHLLSESLGVPIIPISAKLKKGIKDLSKELSNASIGKSTFSKSFEAITFSRETLENFPIKGTAYQQFKMLTNADRLQLSQDEKSKLSNAFNENEIDLRAIEIQEIAARYQIINKLLDKSAKNNNIKGPLLITKHIDNAVTHPFWGTLIFLLVFGLLFQAVFTLAVYPMDWIDEGMAFIAELGLNHLPEGLLTDFLINGVWAGLAGIIVFVPQIMILFGLVTILDESGYMARVSFLNDRILNTVGMSGKSVVSLVGGFACAVPSIMAARSIENWRERLITIMITPLLSCSARLPVYIFLVGFVVPEEYFFGFISLQGIFMLGLYLLGVIMSVIVAFVLNKMLTINKKSSFLMELPVYKWPVWSTIVSSMWFKGKTFIVEAGKIILIVSILLWGLASFGPSEAMKAVEEKYENLALKATSSSSDLEDEKAAALLQASYAGQLGHLIEPAIRPLGFDWQIGIALITSFAAREVFVGTMSVIYSSQGQANSIDDLREKLKNTKNPKTGMPVISSATAASLLIFYVFAMQCMSTLAIVQRETRSWKWPMIQLVSFTAIAYIASLITYQLWIY